MFIQTEMSSRRCVAGRTGNKCRGLEVGMSCKIHRLDRRQHGWRTVQDERCWLETDLRETVGGHEIYGTVMGKIF